MHAGEDSTSLDDTASNFPAVAQGTEAAKPGHTQVISGKKSRKSTPRVCDVEVFNNRIPWLNRHIRIGFACCGEIIDRPDILLRQLRLQALVTLLAIFLAQHREI